MKKFLLPLVSLLISGAAMAEKITVKYYAYKLDGYEWDATSGVTVPMPLTDVEVFKPTTHDLIATSDGTYTIKNFLNASYDLKFSFGTPDDETGISPITIPGLTTNTSLQGLAGAYMPAKYYVDLTSIENNETYNFEAVIYYLAGYNSYKAPAECGVKALAADSHYKYHVVIPSGCNTNAAQSIPVLKDYYSYYPVGSGFCCVFDMILNPNSGLADVVADEDAPVEYFNLQGVRVNADNLTPGVYVKRQGEKAVKFLVK